MSSLKFVGASGRENDILTKRSTDDIVQPTVSRPVMESKVQSAVDQHMTEAQLNDLMDNLADENYMEGRFGLAVPRSAGGVRNGVATLDSAGRIPTAQLPVSSPNKHEIFVTNTPTSVSVAMSDTSGKVMLEQVIPSPGYIFIPMVFATATSQADNNTFARSSISVRIGSNSHENEVGYGGSGNMSDTQLRYWPIVPAPMTGLEGPNYGFTGSPTLYVVALGNHQGRATVTCSRITVIMMKVGETSD